MAAALRIAAKRICGSALSWPPQAFLNAAKELAPRRTSHGAGSSLRRPFSSSSESQAPSLLSDTAAEPTASLVARGEEKKQELLHVLRLIEHLGTAGDFATKVENKRLLHLLGRTPGPAPYSLEGFIGNNLSKIVTGTLAATGALVYMETKLIFPLLM